MLPRGPNCVYIMKKEKKENPHASLQLQQNGPQTIPNLRPCVSIAGLDKMDEIWEGRRRSKRKEPSSVAGRWWRVMVLNHALNVTTKFKLENDDKPISPSKVLKLQMDHNKFKYND